MSFVSAVLAAVAAGDDVRCNRDDERLRERATRAAIVAGGINVDNSVHPPITFAANAAAVAIDVSVAAVAAFAAKKDRFAAAVVAVARGIEEVVSVVSWCCSCCSRFCTANC